MASRNVDVDIEDRKQLRVLYDAAKTDGVVKITFPCFSITSYMMRIRREKKPINVSSGLRNIFHFCKDKAFLNIPGPANKYIFSYGGQKLAALENLSGNLNSNNWFWTKEGSQQSSPLKSFKECKKEMLIHFCDKKIKARKNRGKIAIYNQNLDNNTLKYLIDQA